MVKYKLEIYDYFTDMTRLQLPSNSMLQTVIWLPTANHFDLLSKINKFTMYMHLSLHFTGPDLHFNNLTRILNIKVYFYKTIDLLLIFEKNV